MRASEKGYSNTGDYEPASGNLENCWPVVLAVLAKQIYVFSPCFGASEALSTISDASFSSILQVAEVLQPAKVWTRTAGTI